MDAPDQKKKYRKPVLTDFGPAATLTGAGTGSTVEMGGGMGQTKKRP